MRIHLLGGSLIAATATTAAFAQSLPVEKYPYLSGPVTITSCSVNENTSDSTVSPNSLRINYYANQANRTLTSITFRVRYAQTSVTVTDTGQFGYKQPITHQFNLLGGLPWAGAMPTVCRVVTATFDDGQSVNPPYDGPDAEVPAPSVPAVPAPAPPEPPAPLPSAT
jgi:hypothetical protein